MPILVRSTSNTGGKFNAWVPVAMCHLRTRAPQQKCVYSITSSAMASSVGGISRPIALAVLRLMTNSNLVD